MQVVNTGSMFKIYDNSLKTYAQLPAQAYQVGFDKMTGFFLTKHDDIHISEKIYGVHEEKVNKVFNSFTVFQRNLGVILSGAKGIGKSLFAKMLSVKAIESGYPLVIVSQYIPGIADYLASIQQEVVVLFDEFDKTFYSKGDRDSMADPQSEMLTLFDGLSQGKKLFIVTCNELTNLNNYLVNRPGRFHYHFRFEYPTNDEIREYLEDKIPETAYGEINKVIAFARKVDLNYDCLRAIAFELTLGLSFENAIKDLNIINLSREYYNLTLVFKDGGICRRDVFMDMFDTELFSVELSDENNYDFYVRFYPCDATFDVDKGCNVIKSDAIDEVDWEDHYYSDTEEDKRKLAVRKARQVDYIMIRRKMSKNLHYMV